MRLVWIVLAAAGSFAVCPAAPTTRGRRAPHSVTAADAGSPPAVAGEFRGYHDGASEYSRFVPCRDRSGIPAAHAVRTSAALPEVWMTIANTAWMPPRPWPTRQMAGPLRLHDRTYVRVRGTLVGPGHYGRFGLAPYELRVDSVLHVARTGPRGC